MGETSRRIQWLLLLRLVTLAGVAWLLAPLATVSRADGPWLMACGIGLLLLWVPRLLGAPWRRDATIAAANVFEAIFVSGLVYLYGGPASPLVLLYLPLLAEAAAFLPTSGYMLVAGLAGLGYGTAAWLRLAAAPLPAWTTLLVTGAFLLVALLGVLGAGYRRARGHGARAERRLSRYRALLERLPLQGPDEAFWRLFLGQVAKGGGFTDGALLRWDGIRPRVVATERQAAWEGFAKKNGALLRDGLARTGQPELFEETHDGAKTGRTIVCWPVLRRDDEPAPGVLCLLSPRPLGLPEAGRRLARWVPLASLALAVSDNRLTLQRAPVDWRVLMNATLHRLHKRLASYLVLVDVEPGRIEADALLLAEAIAQSIEEALDHVPPHAQVRLSARKTPAGWAFAIESAARAAEPAGGPRPGLKLAKEVVAAHGGEWHEATGASGYRVAFSLPARQPGT